LLGAVAVAAVSELAALLVQAVAVAAVTLNQAQETTATATRVEAAVPLLQPLVGQALAATAAPAL